MTAAADHGPGVPLLDSAGRLTSATAPATRLLTPLAARERDVVDLVAHGVPTKRIATCLNISPWTVNDHLKAIFPKPGCWAVSHRCAREFRGPGISARGAWPCSPGSGWRRLQKAAPHVPR